MHAHGSFLRVVAKGKVGRGSVHCMKDDQLYKYIVESKKKKKLSDKEIKAISQTLEGILVSGLHYSQVLGSGIGNSVKALLFLLIPRLIPLF
jgi:hypothetical protein